MAKDLTAEFCVSCNFQLYTCPKGLQHIAFFCNVLFCFVFFCLEINEKFNKYFVSLSFC